MQTIVLDSDIIIDHFRIGSKVFSKLVQESVKQTAKVYIPGVVYTEINSGQDSKDKFKLSSIEKLTTTFEFIEANEKISQAAGFLLRDYKHLGIADAIVAATTLSLNAKLASRNKKDFDDIKGLKFFKFRY